MATASILDRLFEATGKAEEDATTADTRSGKTREPGTKAEATADRGEAIGWEAIATIGEDATSTRTDNNDPEARAEAAEMQRAAPLLDLIREDTGEEGKDRGEYIEFRVCPVCHHTDDARYYKATNLLHCFSGSNSGRRTLGYCEYLQDVRGMGKTAAMAQLREVTGHDYADRAGKVETPAEGEGCENPGLEEEPREEPKTAPAYVLPRVRELSLTEPPRRAPELVRGVCRLGDFGTVVAKAKRQKSWCMVRLCVAVANGCEFFGHQCRQGDALLIDPELRPEALDNRVAAVCRVMGCDPEYTQQHVHALSLRGARVGSEAASIEHVARDLSTAHKRGELSGYSLIILDSAAKLLGRRDENASGDVHSFCNTCILIARATGACVIAVLHESKAKSGDREAEDRARGSSAWGDAVDFSISLVRIHPAEAEEEEAIAPARAYMIESAAARDMAAFDPVRFTSEFVNAGGDLWAPRIEVDEAGKLAEWYPSSSADGNRQGGRDSGKTRAAQAQADGYRAQAAILAALYHEGITDPEGMTAKRAREIASEATGRQVNSTRLRGMLEGSEWLTIWKKSPRKQYVCPIHLAPRDDAEEEEGEAGTKLIE